MKFLILSHDLDRAITWAQSQDVPNIFMLDEREIIKENPNKFRLGFQSFDYSKDLCNFMSVKVMTYTSSRPICIIMDMRHQTAVDQIGHSHSILLYDKSRSRRLAYNPMYTTDFTVDFDSKLLQELLQNAG
jgi:hypothetical protein